MLSRSLQVKRLSLLFLVLSLTLWVTKILIREELGEKCGVSSIHTTSAVQPDPELENGVGLAQVTDPAKWLQRKMHSLTSPTHLQLVPSPSCPALNASITSLPAGVPNILADNRDHAVTLAIIGEVHLRPRGRGHPLLGDSKVSTWLGGVSSLIGDADAVLTNFPTSIQRSDKPQEVLSILSSLGSRLVVSLANTALTLQTTDNEVTVTARALDGAGIDWLGVHAKKHHIMAVGGSPRIGLLAFCGVHRECTDGNTLPFSPVKYSSKVAKSAVEELREHGVMLVIVLIYWGLETSYFPDEMALTTARQLATLGVSAVIGHHPNSVQGHAYFGNTLVIFSLGKILTSTKVTNYCFNKASEEYSTTESCSMVHPNLRERLIDKEQQTRIYRLHLSGLRPVVADYLTLRLEEEATGMGYAIRRPAFAQQQEWTRACGETDTQCLACQQF